jgi:hypothetical protein
MSDSKVTNNHNEIRRWVEERGGHPARVKGTGRAGKSGGGLLRIDYPGFTGDDSLEEITWEEFFDQFEKTGLAFLYQGQAREWRDQPVLEIDRSQFRRSKGGVKSEIRYQTSEINVSWHLSEPNSAVYVLTSDI